MRIFYKTKKTRCPIHLCSVNMFAHKEKKKKVKRKIVFQKGYRIEKPFNYVLPNPSTALKMMLNEHKCGLTPRI